MKNLYTKITKTPDLDIDSIDAFNRVLKDGTFYNALPINLQKSSEFLSNLLYHYPTLFNDANAEPISKERDTLLGIITEPISSLDNHPFEALSLAHPKIKTREFCLEMVNINPYNIKHVPEKFLYDSEFIEVALNGDGLTVQYLPSYTKHSLEFALMASKSNGFCLKYFTNDVIYNREVILSALDTKGFSLSQFENPHIMCLDQEIAEKALMADINSMKYFTPENPLIKDKYFAVKMIPHNAKFFSLFDESIRHDADTLLQIVKGKSVENILFIVSQEFQLYPKFFLFALDAYQKCLTEEEKEKNFGFYYYLHTSLFKERQKKFNIVYRRNLERQKEAERKDAEELNRVRELQMKNVENSSFTFDVSSPGAIIPSNAITEDNQIPQSLLISPSLDNAISNSTSTLDKNVSSTNSPLNNPTTKKSSRLGGGYKVQSALDFATNQINAPVNQVQGNSGIHIEDFSEDNFSHLAILADEVDVSMKNDSIQKTPNAYDLENIDPSFIAISQSESNSVSSSEKEQPPESTSQINDSNSPIFENTFMDFKSYTNPKVTKTFDDLNSVKLPTALDVNPQTADQFPNVSRYQAPTERLQIPSELDNKYLHDNDDPEISEDMSPAQIAAKRAFPSRNKSISDVSREPTPNFKPVKKETTRRGTISIFNNTNKK